MLALRTPNAKLIEYPDRVNWTELFDLSTDPYEMKNLASDPDHAALLKKLKEELAAQKKKFGDPFENGTAAY
jgi:arylsulfatase A-like enzyme